MYMLRLNTFLCAADAGSFNRAAELLYMSTPAVIKQINALETEIGVTLFVRSHQGLELTSAGRFFYKDAVYMTQYFKDAVERARNACEKRRGVVRVGISPMTQGAFLQDIQAEIMHYLPDISFQFVPFKNTPEIAEEMKWNFGEYIDICDGVFDEAYLKERRCAALKLRDEPLCVAMAFRHRLAGKQRLSLDDLRGERLMIIKRGWNRYIDRVRDEISRNYPDICLVDVDFNGPDAYNQCEIDNAGIVMIAPWKQAHPLLAVLPVDWDYAVPYGILHALQPTEPVQLFLQAVRRIYAV